MERLYVNFMYVDAEITTESCTCPRTNQRRGNPHRRTRQCRQVRQVLMEAVIKMEALDYPLAPGFLRQMGKEDEAMRVEAVLTNPYNPPSQTGQQKRKEGSDLYEIERILDDEAIAGEGESRTHSFDGRGITHRGSLGGYRRAARGIRWRHGSPSPPSGRRMAWEDWRDSPRGVQPAVSPMLYRSASLSVDEHLCIADADRAARHHRAHRWRAPCSTPELNHRGAIHPAGSAT